MELGQQREKEHHHWEQQPPSSKELLATAKALLADYAERHPYLVLSAAGSLGYIAAAGLPASLLKIVFRSGIQSGLANVVRTAVGSLLEPAIAGHARMYDSVGPGNGS